jgi:hypothetical protein
MRLAYRSTTNWAVSIATVSLLAAVAVAAPAYADGGRVYAGRADGAGMPVVRAADPGGLPGDAALAAQSESFDPQRIYGGVRLNDALAVEAAQKLPFGDASKPADQVVSVAGKASVPLTDGLSLTGKLGVQYSGSIITPDGGLARGDLSRPSPVYGLGLAYQATQGLQLRVESEHVAARAGAPSAATGDSILFGARLEF